MLNSSFAPISVQIVQETKKSHLVSDYTDVRTLQWTSRDETLLFTLSFAPDSIHLVTSRTSGNDLSNSRSEDPHPTMCRMPG